MNVTRIGEAAGELWKRLAEKGPLALKPGAKSAGAEQTLVYLAAGWLAREGKVVCEAKGNDLLLALTEEEQKKAIS